MTTWTIAHQIAFFPTTSGGKVHAAWKISHTAVCGRAVELEQAPWMHSTAGSDSAKAHPMICKACFKRTTQPGATVTGIEQ